MTDVFLYNSGSLFQALNPQKNLVALTGESWANQVEDIFKPTVSVGNELYGAPITSSFGGGILYNKKVYEKLGLQVPKTWAEFMANNAKVKAAGIDPVIQSYQDTWTSQLLVLADYHNIAAADPGWAQKYTNGQVKYAQEPAVKGFQRLEEVHKAGYENKDYRSIKFEKGVSLLAAGKGAHYPMLGVVVGNLATSDPEHINDIGFFGQPGDDAAKSGATIWMPAGLYIPKSTEGAQLEAAKKFVAFVASPEGCDVQTKAFPPSGPYMVKGCELPADVPAAVKDLVAYVKAGKVTPALEFSSPVKGPALEQITVEVGSGLRSAADGAALYDKDVKKQAQQLGLKGWS
jgi:raffinose/stachyose/melibiose transport system substrate-binding protein